MADSKELIIVPTGTFATMVIKYDGGGQLPQELTGEWNSRAKAKSAIDAYLAKPKRGKTNGTEKNKSNI